MPGSERILHEALRHRIISADKAASLFQNGMVVASSGFTKAGDSKVVLHAIAKRAALEPFKIKLITGASLGHGTDGALASADAVSLRVPFQTDPLMRKSINAGDIMFIDENLGKMAELLKNNHLPKLILLLSKLRRSGQMEVLFPPHP